MKLLTLVHVRSVERSIPFYEALGGVLNEVGRSEMWAELAFGDAVVGLHGGEAPSPGETSGGRVRLSLIADRALEEVLADLRASGIEPRGGIQEQDWGRTAAIEDPDGLLTQLVEPARPASPA